MYASINNTVSLDVSTIKRGAKAPQIHDRNIRPVT
jgi:hypothetical protein